jgi:Trp operon repressor
MKQHLKTVAEANKHLNLHVCFSAPDEQDTLGEDYHIVGRVSLDLLKKHCQVMISTFTFVAQTQ